MIVMTVARILAGKGRHVATVAPEQTLHEVSVLLSTQGIGALVVTDHDGRVVGIISERDVVRALAKRGPQALGDMVEGHMTERVVTAGEGATINALMQKMTSGRFRHVPIVEGGRLRGLISIGDVVNHRLMEFEAEQRALKDYIATA
jgi:CBS domain-containing protein